MRSRLSPVQRQRIKELTQRLKTEPFPELRERVKRVELGAILEFVSDKTDIPIWVDAAAFRPSGAKDDIEQVQIDLGPIKNETLAQGLARLMNQINAKIRITDGALIVAP